MIRLWLKALKKRSKGSVGIVLIPVFSAISARCRGWGYDCVLKLSLYLLFSNIYLYALHYKLTHTHVHTHKHIHTHVMNI